MESLALPTRGPPFTVGVREPHLVSPSLALSLAAGRGRAVPARLRSDEASRRG